MVEDSQVSGYPSIQMIVARLDWDELGASANRLERRSSRRFSLRVAAVLIGFPAAGESRLEVDTYDVSEIGVGIVSAVPIPTGTPVVLQSDSGFAVGFVSRCDSNDNQYRCGISFEDCVSTRATVSELLQRAWEPKAWDDAMADVIETNREPRA